MLSQYFPGMLLFLCFWCAHASYNNSVSPNSWIRLKTLNIYAISLESCTISNNSQTSIHVRVVTQGRPRENTIMSVRCDPSRLEIVPPQTIDVVHTDLQRFPENTYVVIKTDRLYKGHVGQVLGRFNRPCMYVKILHGEHEDRIVHMQISDLAYMRSGQAEIYIRNYRAKHPRQSANSTSRQRNQTSSTSSRPQTSRQTRTSMFDDILGSSSFGGDNFFGSGDTFGSFLNSDRQFDEYENFFDSGNRSTRNNRRNNPFSQFFDNSDPFTSFGNPSTFRHSSRTNPFTSFGNPSTSRRSSRTNTSQRNNQNVRQDPNSNGILYSDQLYNNDQFIILSFTISEWFGDQGNPEEVVIFVTPFEEGQKTHGFLPEEVDGLYRHSTHPVNPYNRQPMPRSKENLWKRRLQRDGRFYETTQRVSKDSLLQEIEDLFKTFREAIDIEESEINDIRRKIESKIQELENEIMQTVRDVNIEKRIAQIKNELQSDTFTEPSTLDLYWIHNLSDKVRAQVQHAYMMIMYQPEEVMLEELQRVLGINRVEAQHVNYFFRDLKFQLRPDTHEENQGDDTKIEQNNRKISEESDTDSLEMFANNGNVALTEISPEDNIEFASAVEEHSALNTENLEIIESPVVKKYSTFYTESLNIE